MDQGLSVAGLEEKFLKLKDAIIERLKAAGGDTSVQLQRIGREIIFVVKDTMGWSGLAVDINGTWSVRIGTGGHSLKNPSVDELLHEYALLDDRIYSDMRFFNPPLLPDTDNSGKEEMERWYQKVKNRECEYIEKNRYQILQKFVESMEETLRKISQ